MEVISDKILNAKAIIAIIGDNQLNNSSKQNGFYHNYQQNDDIISIQALKTILELKGIDDYFIVTSSTDGLVSKNEINFQQENLWEVNGSRNYYQCEHGFVFGEWATELRMVSNMFSSLSDSIYGQELTRFCDNGGIARPNVLMGNAHSFNTKRSDQQARNFKKKVQKIVDSKDSFVILQFGKENRNMDHLSEKLFKKSKNATLIQVRKEGIKLQDPNQTQFPADFLPIEGITAQENFSLLALKTLEMAKDRIKNPQHYQRLKEICKQRQILNTNKNLDQIPEIMLVSNIKRKGYYNNLTEYTFKYKRFKGIMAASFTPINKDGSVKFDQYLYNKYAEDLLAQNVTGVFANGTSGESVSLSCEERQKILECWMATPSAKSGKLTVICHIGCNNLPDSTKMLLHAQKAGAHGAAFFSPSYYKPKTTEQVANVLCTIAQLTPNFPLYYYHIPMMNGVECNIEECLNLANARCPNIVGMKYTGQDFDKYSPQFFKKFNVLVGADNMLVKSFKCGADGAIGIGYNFAGEWARNIYDAVKIGDLDWAEQNQDVFRKFWKIVFDLPHGLGGPGKYLSLSMRGIDLGPLRWPQVPLSEQGKRDTDSFVKPVFIKCKRNTNLFSRKPALTPITEDHWQGQFTEDRFKYKRFKGIMAASFTPIKEDGSVNFDQNMFNNYAEDLLAQNVTGVFVNGTSGESVSLSCEERQKILEFWMQTEPAMTGKLTVICHVGCNNFTDTTKMLLHAQKVGANGAAFISPSYFKPQSAEQIADLICSVAKLTPNLPIYYSHIPMMNGINCDVEKCLNLANARCPNVVGIKYFGEHFGQYSPKFFKKFNFLIAYDKNLINSYKCGADGAIGICYNFAGEWARNVYDAMQQSDDKWAESNQDVFIKFWKNVFDLPHGFGGPAKYLMLKMRGINLGPLKWPQVPLSIKGKQDTTKFIKPLFQKCFRDYSNSSLIVEQNIQIKGQLIPKRNIQYGPDLILNGVGVAQQKAFGFFKSSLYLYVAALYNLKMSGNYSRIIYNDQPSIITLKWIQAMQGNECLAILDKTFSNIIQDYKSVEFQIGLFKKALTTRVVRKVKVRSHEKVGMVLEQSLEVGDTFDIVYTPKRGTELYRNNELLLTVKGLGFKIAIWSYWLGEDPVDRQLKKVLLGK